VSVDGRDALKVLQVSARPHRAPVSLCEGAQRHEPSGRARREPALPAALGDEEIVHWGFHLRAGKVSRQSERQAVPPCI
jgi:hypothetical protein